ncbi:MAG TPA: hypothetical protein VII02_05200 [Gemmatimonadaceae bacterium]
MSAALNRDHILAVAYVVVAVLLVMWDILVAGRIAQLRRAPRAFAAITALAGLLLLPALIVAYSAASILYGRAIQPITWIWPIVTLLFAIQATYALSRRLVTPLFGVPVAVYNVIIAIVAVSRFSISRGGAPPEFCLALSAAQASSLGFFFGPPALWGAAYLFVPVFSPSLRARWRISGAVRGIIAALVGGIAALVLILMPSAFESIRSYSHYATEQLQEHPEGDFDLGLKVFPDLKGPPPPLSLDQDIKLADSLNVDAVSIVVDAEGARLAALDSMARTVDDQRADSTLIIITLGYPSDALNQFRTSEPDYTKKRLADVDRIARRLRPDILVPALDPYGAGSLAIGTQPPEYWIDYLSRAAAIAHHVNPRIRVGVAASSYGARDSTLFAWAASRGSPIDVLGFTLMPGFDGARSLDNHMRIAQRWMRPFAARPKPAWVMSAGGYPLIHGEKNQELALWGVLAWATTQPAIKGLIVTEAGDYDAIRGLRAPGGRLRSSVSAVMRAQLGLKQTAAP